VFELIGYLIGLAASLYVAIATIAFLWGLARFLIEAPGAIRRDLEERRRRRPTPLPRQVKRVPNEEPPALPPVRPALPPSNHDENG
jgi:hypothetical protein